MLSADIGGHPQREPQVGPGPDQVEVQAPGRIDIAQAPDTVGIALPARLAQFRGKADAEPERLTVEEIDAEPDGCAGLGHRAEVPATVAQIEGRKDPQVALAAAGIGR